MTKDMTILYIRSNGAPPLGRNQLFILGLSGLNNYVLVAGLPYMIVILRV